MQTDIHRSGWRCGMWLIVLIVCVVFVVLLVGTWGVMLLLIEVSAQREDDDEQGDRVRDRRRVPRYRP